MEKTLGAILEEGAVKIGAKQTTNIIPDASNSGLFNIKRTLETREYGNFEAVASSSKKKSAQHLAAGQILLQILDKPCWNFFPFKLPSAEDVRIALEAEIESLQGEGMTVAENPIGSLQTICKQRNLPDPTYDFEDVRGNPKLFMATCRISDQYEISSTASSKKQAKANAARDMLLLMPKNDGHPSSFLSKDSEDGFQPALSDERMKASPEESKKEILEIIENSVRSAGEDVCSKDVVYLEKKRLLEKIFKMPILIESRDHKSLDPSKMLRTLHIVNAAEFKKIKQLCRKTVLYSFIGIGENDKSAKNEAARNLLFYVKSYYELRVVD